MIDIDSAILEAFVSSMSTLSYSGNNVPVYSGFNPNNETIYVILNAPDNADNSTKTFRSDNSFILIDIVHRAGADATYDVVNNIANQIVGLSFTSPDNTLQFTNVRLESTNALMLTQDSGNIVRKLLRYSLRVHQSTT